MSYKLLYKDKNIEIRKYPPCHRTLAVINTNGISIIHHHYFVPLPYQVYVDILLPPGSRISYGGVRLFCLSFAKEDDNFVYPTPFYGASQYVCIDQHWHFGVPKNAKLEEAIRRFWSTNFWEPGSRLREVLGVDTLKEWSKLTTEDVLKRLRYSRHSIEEMVNTIKKTYLIR